MGRDLAMRRPGAPLLPGWVLCDCGFVDVGATDTSTCRRPRDRCLDEALTLLAPDLILPPRTHGRDRRQHVQYEAGYFRAGAITTLWRAMEEAGVADPEEVDYGATLSAERAHGIGTALSSWGARRRAALIDRDVLAAEVMARLDEERRDASEWGREPALERAMIDLRDERDRAFDDLRWVECFAVYNDLAALFDGYSVG